MIEKEDINKKLALDFCSQFEDKKDSQSVFDFVPKTEFIQTLYALIYSNGEYIYQSKNTCGIAAIMHLSSSNDILSFTRFAISLFETGVGELNGYKITKEQNLLKWSKEAKPKNQFNGVSLVVIGSIRFVENTSIMFRSGTMDGMTWPREIITVSKEVLASVLVKQASFLLGWKISHLHKLLSEDKNIILLYRTSSWKNTGNFFKDAWHYIVLIDLVVLENKMLELIYWDYGVIKQIQVSKFHFYSSVIKTFVFSKVLQ